MARRAHAKFRIAQADFQERGAMLAPGGNSLDHEPERALHRQLWRGDWAIPAGGIGLLARIIILMMGSNDFRDQG